MMRYHVSLRSRPSHSYVIIACSYVCGDGRIENGEGAGPGHKHHVGGHWSHAPV